jgi:hypothetical protein
MGNSRNHNEKRAVVKSHKSSTRPIKGVAGSPSANLHGPDVGPTSSLFSYVISQFLPRDALLDAAQDGWGTTIRYAFLLCVRRVTAGAGIWLVVEFARHLGRF